MMSKILLNMRSADNKDHELELVLFYFTAQFHVPFIKIFLFFSTCPNENVFPILLNLLSLSSY